MRQEDRAVGPTEVLARFLGCATLGLRKARAQDVLEQVRTLERLNEVRRLTQELAGPGASR